MNAAERKAGLGLLAGTYFFSSPTVFLFGAGLRRAFAAASPLLAGGHLLAAIEASHNDGPWERPDDFSKMNGVLRYSRGTSRDAFSLTGIAYAADWQATYQVPNARSRRD